MMEIVVVPAFNDVRKVDIAYPTNFPGNCCLENFSLSSKFTTTSVLEPNV